MAEDRIQAARQMMLDNPAEFARLVTTEDVRKEIEGRTRVLAYDHTGVQVHQDARVAQAVSAEIAEGIKLGYALAKMGK